MPRLLNDIAVDVAELLGDGDDEKAIARITLGLVAVQRIHQDGGDVTKAHEIKTDIAAERLRLQRLKEKWRRIAAVQTCLHEADQWLAVLANVTGPDPRRRWFDDVCAIMARGMILQSRDKRLGDRLRLLAGLLYEAATGDPDQLLETACRRVTSGVGRLPHISIPVPPEGASLNPKPEN